MASTPIPTDIATIEIANPSMFARAKEPITLSYADLGVASQRELADISVAVGNTKLAYQHIDSDYDGENDSLLVLVDLAKGKTVTLSIERARDNAALVSNKLTQAEISHKVGGQWQSHAKYPDTQFKQYVGGQFENVQSLTPPAHYTDHSNWIRYEGPGIESDKVGYRIYLDWRNGFDIFGKTTRKPALQKVGVDGYDSYHHMQPWGMDILKVGSSLGAGGFGLWNDQQLSLVNEVDSWQANISENGDLRSRIKIDYFGWKNSINRQDITSNISMLGGSRLAKLNLALGKDLPAIAAGIVKHKDTELIVGNQNIAGDAYTYIASWGQQSLDKSMLGMAVFFKKNQLIEATQDQKNYLALLKPKGAPGQQRVEYFFAAVWQPESGIATKQDFVNYLNQETEKLTIRPRLRIETALSLAAKSQPLTAQSALQWSTRLADSELARKTLNYHYAGWDINRQRAPKFEYDIIGLLPFAYDELGRVTGDEKYLNVIAHVTGSFVTEQGGIKRFSPKSYNIDSIAPGRNILRLYQQTKDKKYQQAAQFLRHQLEKHPRTTEGAFWHKKKYTSQIWLDGVYMGMPYLAEYATMFEDKHQRDETLEEVVNEFELSRKYLRNPENGLYFHAWDELKQQEWANKKTGLSALHWARGQGWLAMALVDVLDYIPLENVSQRQRLISMVNELAQSVVDVQDPETGTWWQIMDRPNAIGNYRESSATAMYAYFLAKAINKGYLPSKYTTNATDAFNGLINEFVLVHTDGKVSMTNQCLVAGLGFGRDGSYNYYMSEPVFNNDPKGTGPLILAGIEIHRLLGSKEVEKPLPLGI